MSCRDVKIQNASDEDDFEHRLKAKLDERKAEAADKAPSNMSQGLRYGSEFIGGFLACAGLGYIADWLIGTSPWGFLVGVLLGFGAGTLNVVRAAQQINRDNNPDLD